MAEEYNAYSSKKISPKLASEIDEALRKVGDFGSVELYIQNSQVTQITIRTIRKTSAKPFEPKK